MKVTLETESCGQTIKKTLIFIPRKDEVLVTTEDGKEIASLDICIMEKDDEHNNRVPTNSFWLQFHPVEPQPMNNVADVWLD